MKVTYRRWSDGQVVEADLTPLELHRLAGDVVRVEPARPVAWRKPKSRTKSAPAYPDR